MLDRISQYGAHLKAGVRVFPDHKAILAYSKIIGPFFKQYRIYWAFFGFSTLHILPYFMRFKLTISWNIVEWLSLNSIIFGSTTMAGKL